MIFESCEYSLSIVGGALVKHFIIEGWFNRTNEEQTIYISKKTCRNSR